MMLTASPSDGARRRFLFAGAAAASLAACGSVPTAPSDPNAMPPIVFVPGNGDTAALWTTTIWRFESNGWPRDRLHAIDLPYPLARDDDTVPQPGRTSSTDHRDFLSAEVARVRARTGAATVVLVGNSRGGNAIRNFIAFGGGREVVSHAVLGGTPNHGVFVDRAGRLGSEFNGAGPFLTRLNGMNGPDGPETTPGVRFLTLRSDRFDKFAQPDGAWIGQPGVATGVTFDGPALRGAENAVLAGVDHRETSFSAAAFAETFRFVTGRAPATTEIRPERVVVLDGRLSGLGLDNRSGAFANNLPLVGAMLTVYATDPATGARLGAARHVKTIGADGRWGPFTTDPRTPHEFVIEPPAGLGYAITHVHRSPFLRGSDIVSLRAERILEADRDAAGLVTLTRPRGYFGIPRDTIALDGVSPPRGIPAGGVPGLSTAKTKLADATERPVVGQFRDERIVGRVRPLAENRVVVLELTH
jgi:pimeloyl-ACP methyl ester carboxylesterase